MAPVSDVNAKSMKWYCPSCRAQLLDGSNSLSCPECAADFGPLADWGPVANDKGEWIPRNEAAERQERHRSLGFGFAALIGRLVLVALATVVIFALALVSSIPYGGGGAGLLQLAALVMLSGTVWAAWPLLRVIHFKISDSRHDPRSRSDEV